MNKIEAILKEARENKWPYPKMFESLKNAGVRSNSVSFINGFESIFEGDFGVWQAPTFEGYVRPVLSDAFSEEGIKTAILERAQRKISYMQLLAALAAQGISHYKADMTNNTVTYFNEDEDRFYEQAVPVWKE